MARIAQEVNPKSKDRLKQLCLDAGISQSRLAELAGLSQNTISKIATGQSPLTHNVATLIVEAFPMYRTEWLEGLDDEPTISGSQFVRSALKAARQRDVLHNAIASIAMLCGCTISPIKSDVEAGNALLVGATTGCLLTKGRSSISLTDEEMTAFESECVDFIDLKIRHLFAQKTEVDNNG